MTGIVLISHGALASGMLAAARMVYDDADRQTVALGLGETDDADDFAKRVEQAVRAVDSGEGVVILADLLGGTPCNRAAHLACEAVQIVTGANLVMLLEVLGMRESAGPLRIEDVLEAGRSGIASCNRMPQEES